MIWLAYICAIFAVTALVVALTLCNRLDFAQRRIIGLEELIERRSQKWYDTALRLVAVESLIYQAKQVSPSDRMTVYVGDLLHALGLADQPARTRTGSNDGGETP